MASSLKLLSHKLLELDLVEGLMALKLGSLILKLQLHVLSVDVSLFHLGVDLLLLLGL